MKKLLSLLFVFSILLLNTVPVSAECCNEKTQAVEHLNIHKNAPCNVVTITNLRKVI